jgi:hypothetical protein
VTHLADVEGRIDGGRVEALERRRVDSQFCGNGDRPSVRFLVMLVPGGGLVLTVAPRVAKELASSV